MEERFLKEIKSFLDEDGMVTGVPAKRKRQLIALCYIAEKLPEGELGNEKEVNALLNSCHTFGDPAWIRREFVEFGILKRDPYGRRYETAADAADKIAAILAEL